MTKLTKEQLDGYGFAVGQTLPSARILEAIIEQARLAIEMQEALEWLSASYRYISDDDDKYSAWAFDANENHYFLADGKSPLEAIQSAMKQSQPKAG